MISAISVDTVILLHSPLKARKTPGGPGSPGGLTRPLSLGEEEENLVIERVIIVGSCLCFYFGCVRLVGRECVATGSLKKRL